MASFVGKIAQSEHQTTLSENFLNMNEQSHMDFSTPDPRSYRVVKRKSLAKQLMPLLWQKNGTKTQPGKVRSNYRLDNSSRAQLFVCACRHRLIREERRRGS
jgi:hypothetical protein